MAITPFTVLDVAVPAVFIALTAKLVSDMLDNQKRTDIYEKDRKDKKKDRKKTRELRALAPVSAVPRNSVRLEFVEYTSGGEMPHTESLYIQVDDVLQRLAARIVSADMQRVAKRIARF